MFTEQRYIFCCHCALSVQGYNRLQLNSQSVEKGKRWKWKRKRRIAGLVCPLCPGLNGLLYTGSWDLVLQCVLLLHQILKWGECIKRPKRAAGLHGQNLHPSETDAVLEYFPSNMFPSLSLSLSDLLSMPMVTLEALWVPGECEISLAGQQPAQWQTPASSCGTHHHFRMCAVLPGFNSLARHQQKVKMATVERMQLGQSGSLRIDHKGKQRLPRQIKA